MADSKHIFASLNAMAKATHTSLKILMGKIEYRQLRNQLFHDVGSDEGSDIILKKLAENLSDRQKNIRLLSQYLQESCDSFLDYLDSFTDPVLESEVSLAIKQVELFMSSDKRNDEDIIGYINIPEERFNEVITRLESLPNNEQMSTLISRLKEWASERNDLNKRIEEKESAGMLT